MTNDEIEGVARGICSALGLDPDEKVGGGAYDDDTPAERRARAPLNGVVTVPLVLRYMPRWRLYRGKAAEALATQAALAAQAKS